MDTKNDIIIDWFGKRHLPRVIDIERIVLKERARTAQRIENDCWTKDNAMAWVAAEGELEEERVFGFLSGYYDEEVQTFYIEVVAVLESHRGRGLQLQLLDNAAREL